MKLEKDFGQYGGQYVPETLMTVLKVLEKEYEEYCFTDEFKNEFMYYMKEYVGRPSALTYCERLTKELGGAKVYLKREDLNHTGAHKINNALAQALLAKHMGKTKVIAETGAGQHGVATATAAAETPNSSSRALTSSLSSRTVRDFTSSIMFKIFSEAMVFTSVCYKN